MSNTPWPNVMDSHTYLADELLAISRREHSYDPLSGICCGMMRMKTPWWGSWVWVYYSLHDDDRSIELQVEQYDKGW